MSFFVPDSSRPEGLELLHFKIKTIYDEQFDISYYIKGISWEDTENMAIFERKEIYNRLLIRKQEEKAATEEAMKDAQKGRIQASSRPSRPQKRRVRR